MGTAKALRPTIALCIALAALCLGPGSALADTSSAPASGGPLATLARTLVLAVAPRGAGETVSRIGDSLALLEARKQVEAKVAAEARAAQSKAAAEASEAAAEGPSKLAPASAGSNGTVVPQASKLSREKIFAHTRAGDPGSTAILLTGVALAPTDAPEAVKGVINNANEIVGRPYVWGGGHGSFYSWGYDCSGAVSFALFGGGLIPEPLTSGSLEQWGAPGPGKWITVYANAEHAFMEIAGLRFDTVGDAHGTGPRWHLASTDTSGFIARHPPGL